jgi:hypothetical protein
MKFKDLIFLLEDDDTPISGDTEGIDPGETGMPRGQGYPNINKDIDDVVRLGVIEGVSKEEENRFNETYTPQLKQYLKQKLPWLVPYEGYSYDYLSTVEEINHFIVNAGSRFRYWYDSDLSLDLFRDNPELDKQRKQKVLDILEMYPDAMSQLDKFNQFLEYVYKDNPTNPENQSNYPLFVSLYDVTRSLGGHEEGGWWYDVDALVESKQVSNFKQAENAAKYLYNKLRSYNLDGKPIIVLEKRSGSVDTTKNPAPKYE